MTHKDKCTGCQWSVRDECGPLFGLLFSVLEDLLLLRFRQHLFIYLTSPTPSVLDKQKVMSNPWPEMDTWTYYRTTQAQCQGKTQWTLLDTFHLLTWKICMPRMVNPRVREASISLLSCRNEIVWKSLFFLYNGQFSTTGKKKEDKFQDCKVFNLN